MATILVDDFPELALICWNRQNRLTDEEEAFRLYEAGWRYVDQTRLSLHERKFIQKLMNTYGNGVLNV